MKDFLIYAARMQDALREWFADWLLTGAMSTDEELDAVEVSEADVSRQGHAARRRYSAAARCDAVEGADTMNADTILPCPFCGNVGLDFAEGSTFRWLAYSCGGCGIGSETRVQTMGEGSPEQWRQQAERDAVKEWNRRAPRQDADTILRELVACKDAEPYDEPRIARAWVAAYAWADAQKAAPPAAQPVPGKAAHNALPLVERLRNTPNWMRESYGSWKDCVLTYDRSPFEAADEIERLRAAQVEPAPAGFVLVPVEPTEAMIGAYLTANAVYWQEVDALPSSPTAPWRQGTPKDATRVSLKAALAAADAQKAAPPAAQPLTNIATDALEGYKAGLAGEPMGFVSEAFDCGWTSGDHERRAAPVEPAPAQPLKFPTMLRKMWSGTEVQAWLDAQAAAQEQTK